MFSDIDVAMTGLRCANVRLQANGAGILVQQDKFTDIEKGLATSRATWMTEEILNDFRGGRKAAVFDVPSKAKI